MEKSQSLWKTDVDSQTTWQHLCTVQIYFNLSLKQYTCEQLTHLPFTQHVIKENFHLSCNAVFIASFLLQFLETKCNISLLQQLMPQYKEWSSQSTSKENYEQCCQFVAVCDVKWKVPSRNSTMIMSTTSPDGWSNEIPCELRNPSRHIRPL